MFIVLSRPDVNKCKNHGKKNNVRVLVHKKENNNMYISINQGGVLTYPANFNGLTKKMKNRIYLDGQKDIEEILNAHPNTYPVVGQLPNFIFKKLPADNKRAAIREIFEAFDKVAEEIRNYDPNSQEFFFDVSKRHRPESVNKILTDVFRKYNIISKWDDDINLKYIDQGGKGKVFKIEGLYDPDTEDEFVIKVFHQLKGKDWQPFKSHGCYAEINNGMYWRQHEGHDTHRGKFFFASFKSGFIVSKYLDEDVRVPKRIVPEYKYGIKCTDEEKTGPLNGYNRIKGYNYDYGGMRVVNRLKNGDKVARTYLEKLKELSPENRIVFWNNNFIERDNPESKVAGLALGIKYMNNKNFYIDKCIERDLPKVNQALGYVLKYLPHEDAVKYFEKLVQTKDKVTQIILFNEIPLLAKRKDENTKLEDIQDDINSSLLEIIPEYIYEYYMIAEKYALPETVEHLASFVHLLPLNKIKQQYTKLTNIQNYALQDRLIWKFSYLPSEYQDYAALKLANKIVDPYLKTKMASVANCLSPDTKEEVLKILNITADDV